MREENNFDEAIKVGITFDTLKLVDFIRQLLVERDGVNFSTDTIIGVAVENEVSRLMKERKEANKEFKDSLNVNDVTKKDSGCPECGMEYSFYFKKQFHRAGCSKARCEE